MLTKISMSPFTQIILRIFFVNLNVNFLIKRHERKFRIDLHFHTPEISMETTRVYELVWQCSSDM